MKITPYILQLVLVVVIMSTTWLAPRHWGLLGLITAHLVCVACWFAIGAICFESGIWRAYEDFLDISQLLIQAIALNVCLLPLGIWAMVCWRRNHTSSTHTERQTAIEMGDPSRV